jgi:hypothetical protein
MILFNVVDPGAQDTIKEITINTWLLDGEFVCS